MHVVVLPGIFYVTAIEDKNSRARKVVDKLCVPLDWYCICISFEGKLVVYGVNAFKLASELQDSVFFFLFSTSNLVIWWRAWVYRTRSWRRSSKASQRRHKRTVRYAALGLASIRHTPILQLEDSRCCPVLGCLEIERQSHSVGLITSYKYNNSYSYALYF